MDAALDRVNPWPGLASYDEAAQAYFAGRDAEIADLVRRITDEPVTVLFGKSGLGKSSLLKAGVFPVLRQRGLLPVPLRLLFGSDAPEPFEQIAQALFEAFAAENIDHPPRADGELLWDYLHRDGLRFWTPKVRPVQPVFVLDQFEEVFTLGRRAGGGVADALRDRLADLAGNRIPAQLAERAERNEALALDVHAQPYKIVLSLREDFLPDLEGWVQAMPSLRRNRMRLAPLQRREALQAVHNERTAHLVDAALAARIVDYLAGAADGDAAPVVEPALLSLVCRGINEARKHNDKERFDDAMFEAGKGRIVVDFYRESLADQPARVARFIEDELVTEQGFRNSYSVVAAVERGLVRREEIAALVDRRLLRLEHHLGAERVELTHDLLTRAVLEGRGRRVAQEAGRQRRRILWRYGSAGLAAIALIVVLIGVLYNHRVSSERQHLAQSRELAATSRNELARDAQLAIVLAAEGLRSADSNEARSALLRALRGSWPSADLAAEALGGEGRALDIDPTGTRLAVVNHRGQISLWGIEQRVPVPLWDGAKKSIDLPNPGGQPGLTFAADGSNLYVAAKGGVQRFEVTGGGARQIFPIPLPADQSEEIATQLAVSRDGRWLAALFSGRRLLMRPLSSDQAEWEEVRVEAAVGGDDKAKFELVALSADGRRIVGVRSDPLRAVNLERNDGGRWTSTPVDSAAGCLKPQSISLAPDKVVSTWEASACIASLSDGSAPKRVDALSRAIRDSISSSLGGAYVAIMSNGDLQVGVGVPAGGGVARTLRGLGGEAPGNMSGLFAVDERARRVALFSSRGAARVFHVGDERLLLTETPGQVSAATADGRWLAQVHEAEGDPQAAELRLYELDRAYLTPKLPSVVHRVKLPALVRAIHATRERLLVTLDEQGTRRTVVVDAAKGAIVNVPLEGEVEKLGSAAELLVVPAGRDALGRPLATIVRRSDDKLLAPWGTGRAGLIDVSQSGHVALVRYPGEAGTLRADAYSVRGGELQRIGQLVGLPDSTDGRFEPSDDGRRACETRVVMLPATDPGRPPRRQRQMLCWPLRDGEVVDARRIDGVAPREVPDDDGAAVEVAGRSPKGSYELLARGGREALLTRAGTHEPELEFPARVRALTFSGDERLLAYAVEGESGRDAALHVQDLSARRPWLELPRVAAADRIGFEAGGRLIQTDSQLVPIDTQLLLRFARWHVQTPLPEAGCKRHRLEDTDWCARPAAAPAPASR